jgi:polyisoprenoid-binding protein YceI
MHASVPLPEDATVRHIIDASQSTFVVQVFATGLLSAFGHNPSIAARDFDGGVDFTSAGGAIVGARLSVRIRSGSLEVTDDINEKDRAEIHRRMCDEVLETDRFPEIAYECSQVTASGDGSRYWASLKGEMTLHGITRNLPVSVKVILNGNSLRASGEFTLSQREYGLAPVSAAGGTIRVKDAVKITFDIVARRQE